MTERTGTRRRERACNVISWLGPVYAWLKSEAYGQSLLVGRVHGRAPGSELFNEHPSHAVPSDGPFCPPHAHDSSSTFRRVFVDFSPKVFEGFRRVLQRFSEVFGGFGGSSKVPGGSPEAPRGPQKFWIFRRFLDGRGGRPGVAFSGPRRT